MRTHEAHQRELERFYLWCIVVQKKALSSIDTQDALAFQAFLRAIPSTGSPGGACRAHTALAAVSQAAGRAKPAIRDQHRVDFYDACRDGGYLTANLFADLLAHAKAVHVKRLDATRSLTDDDPQHVALRLAALPGSPRSTGRRWRGARN